MVVKVKEIFEKTRLVKNKNKSKKYTLRGQRNVRRHERILCNENKSYNSTYIYNFVFISNSTYFFPD